MLFFTFAQKIQQCVHVLTCFDKDLQHYLKICLFAYWQFFSWMLYPFDKAKIALSCKKSSQLLDTLMVILAKAKSLSSIIQKLNRRGGRMEEGADSRAAQAEPTANTCKSYFIFFSAYATQYISLGALHKFLLKIYQKTRKLCPSKACAHMPNRPAQIFIWKTWTNSAQDLGPKGVCLQFFIEFKQH